MGICLTPQDCLVQAADTFWSGLADQVRTAAGEMLTALFGWWTATRSTPVDQQVLHVASGYVLTWIAFPVALLALLATIGWGLLGGADEWVRNAVRGSLVFGGTAAAGIVVVATLQEWAESLSLGILAAVPAHDLGARLVDLLDLPGVSLAQVTFWGGLLFLAGAVQWVIMLFRDGAVVVLTVVLPLAAAGQFARGSRGWLPKLSGWLLAFVFLKPMAALIYWLGLSLIGQGQGVQAVATGFVVMVGATLALPAMLRLVSFATDGLPDGHRGLSAVATATGLAATGAQLFGHRLGGSAGSPGAGSAGMGSAGAGSAGTGSGLGVGAGAVGGPAGAPLLAAGAIRVGVSGVATTAAAGASQAPTSGATGPGGAPGGSAGPGPSGAQGPSTAHGPSGAPRATGGDR
jgi:hypothetical protein